MNYIIQGALPGPLVNMNNPPESVREKIRRDQDKARWRRDCYYRALAIARKEKWPLPFSKVTIQVTLGVPDKRHRDPHNFEANAKPLVDALVDAAIIPGDDPRYVQMLPIKLSRELKGQFTVEITPTYWEDPA